MPQRRLIAIQVACLALFFALLVIAFGATMAENAIHIAREKANGTGRDVKITTPDGATLGAWLLQPSRPTQNYVIVLHGFGGNRGMLPRITQMLLKNGYTVLAPDSRAHGESTGDIVTYGVREAPDVHLWADFLYRTEPVKNLYGLGESMGAAVLLQSLVYEPRFRAVTAESPFSTFQAAAVDRILQNLGSGSIVARSIAVPVVSSGLLYARIRYGVDLGTASPLHAVRHSLVPILLIHGLKDRNIFPQHSRDLLLANPAHIVPWFVPKAGHSGAFLAAPDVFEERVVSFFLSYQH